MNRSLRFQVSATLILALQAAGCTFNFVPPNIDVIPPVVSDPDLSELELRLIHAGLDRPVDLQSPADGTDRLFIVEQAGRIRISESGNLEPIDAAFLNITDRVLSSGNEQGLLGLAFHPDFAGNGRFFVNFTAPGGESGMTTIAEFAVDSQSGRADPESMRIILQVEQPFSNHNGGQLQFGPDGMLYIGLGDGGSACDPRDLAQNPQSLLGKIIRLDVDAEPPFVPPDNPFVGDEETRDEILALGLRNPFRFAFNPEGTHLYIADVGQSAVEEISAIRFAKAFGANFGWPAREGTLMPPPGCAGTDFDVSDPVDPVLQYSHEDGCSIIGGYVWTNDSAPDLLGAYLFSDFCTPFLRVLLPTADGRFEQADLTDRLHQDESALNRPASFGRDQFGRLYILDLDGDVFLIVARSTTDEVRGNPELAQKKIHR